MVTEINVKCGVCGKEFKKTLRRYNESVKNGWNFYCSKKCEKKYKTKSIRLKCSECKKNIKVSNGQFQKSKSKRFFCGKSCSAKFNNKLRGARTDEVKRKISKGLALFHKRDFKYIEHKNCIICRKIFKPKKRYSKCCSLQCGQIYQFGSLPYTKDDVINGILNKYEELSRTPQRRDCLKRVASAASRLFGTWNKAIIECGLEPNSSKYQRVRLKCKDGHIADSISEMIIDDWFFDNNIKHMRNKKYPDSNFDCDFYFPDYDLWVEYFGLLGQVKKYDEGVKIKRKLIKKHSLKFVELKPSDLYPDNNLQEIFKKYV